VAPDTAQLEEKGGKGCSGRCVLHDMMHDITDFDFTMEEVQFRCNRAMIAAALPSIQLERASQSLRDCKLSNKYKYTLLYKYNKY
jgi:hypothetical protein